MRKIAPKILQLLTEWTETFPYDFRDERMMRNLKDLAHRMASGEEVGHGNVVEPTGLPGGTRVGSRAELTQNSILFFFVLPSASPLHSICWPFWCHVVNDYSIPLQMSVIWSFRLLFPATFMLICVARCILFLFHFGLPSSKVLKLTY